MSLKAWVAPISGLSDLQRVLKWWKLLEGFPSDGGIKRLKESVS